MYLKHGQGVLYYPDGSKYEGNSYAVFNNNNNLIIIIRTNFTMNKYIFFTKGFHHTVRSDVNICWFKYPYG